MILEEFIQTKKHTIVKNSKEEKKFIGKLIIAIKGLNIDHITSKEVLEWIIYKFTDNMEKIWLKNSKIINITNHFKLWWNCYMPSPLIQKAHLCGVFLANN